MSGGHFEYRNHVISDIAYELGHIIENNDDEELGDYGEPKGHGFNKETIDILTKIK